VGGLVGRGSRVRRRSANAEDAPGNAEQRQSEHDPAADQPVQNQIADCLEHVPNLTSTALPVRSVSSVQRHSDVASAERWSAVAVSIGASSILVRLMRPARMAAST
jgi:hypothetical protein